MDRHVRNLGKRQRQPFGAAMMKHKYKAQFQNHDLDVPERVEVVFEADVDELKIVPSDFIGNEAQWYRFAVIRKARTFLPPGRWTEMPGGVYRIIEHGAASQRAVPTARRPRNETSKDEVATEQSEGFAERLLERAANEGARS
jgi:hypothetical protein